MLAAILVMGVSGSGKTSVGAMLARELTLAFVDADALHPAHNRRKMASGIALDDADRAPWLEKVGAELAAGNVVVACSALRRNYRDRLRAAAPGLRIAFLQGSYALIAQRIEGRRHAFMSPSLLKSQLATLEPPSADEHAFTMDISRSPEEIVARIAAWAKAPASAVCPAHQDYTI